MKPETIEEKPAAKVLVLRTCDDDMKSHGGFQWPESGPVVAPDWSPVKECGKGLHGWLWGSGDWSLKQKAEPIWWVVVEVDSSGIIDLIGKVKFQTGNVVARSRKWNEAMAFIRGYAAYPTTNNSVATGDSGHASSTGNSGHASSTGDHGHASSTGYSGHASSTGDHGWAVAGFGGRARAARNGVITLLWCDGNRPRVVTGYVGEDGIEADIWYVVKNGKLEQD